MTGAARMQLARASPARYDRLAAACAGAFVAVLLAAALGWLRPLDRRLTRVAFADTPCAARGVSAALNIAFSGEASLLYTGIGALVLLRRRQRHLAGWLVGLVLATMLVEYACKHLPGQPSPGAFVATLARRPCAAASPGAAAARAARDALPSAAIGRGAYVALSSMPSGYAARAALGATLLAAALGAPRPRLAALARAALAALVALLGATRVIVAWHWPSDVLGGTLLGVAAACLLLARARPVAAPGAGAT